LKRVTSKLATSSCWSIRSNTVYDRALARQGVFRDGCRLGLFDAASYWPHRVALGRNLSGGSCSYVIVRFVSLAGRSSKMTAWGRLRQTLGEDACAIADFVERESDWSAMKLTTTNRCRGRKEAPMLEEGQAYPASNDANGRAAPIRSRRI